MSMQNSHSDFLITVAVFVIQNALHCRIQYFKKNLAFLLHNSENGGFLHYDFTNDAVFRLN